MFTNRKNYGGWGRMLVVQIFLVLYFFSSWCYSEDTAAKAFPFHLTTVGASEVFYIKLGDPSIDKINVGSILARNGIIVVDASDVQSDEDRNKACVDLIGVGFDTDFTLVGKREGLPYFSTFDQGDRTSEELEAEIYRRLERISQFKKQPRQPRRSTRDSDDDTTTTPVKSPPMIVFYVEQSMPLSRKACTFPGGQYSSVSSFYACAPDGGAEIDLLMRVRLMRSLPGPITPDKKVVVINVGGIGIGGKGIKINDSLHSIYLGHQGWDHGYGTSAYAHQYSFGISYRGGPELTVFDHLPRNVNGQYDNTETQESGFSVGVEAGAEVGAEGPKVSASVSASYSYTETKSISYTTSDFDIKKITRSNAIIAEWTRGQNATPCELSKLDTTNCGWNTAGPEYAYDLSKIKSMAYSNFSPELMLVVGTSPDTTGVTEFTLTTQVTLRVLYAIDKFAVTYWHGPADKPKYNDQIAEVKTRFNVDWNASVFMGGNVVNLRLDGTNNKCLAVKDGNKIGPADCSISDNRQRFRYIEGYRYESVSSDALCLSATTNNGNLNMATCGTQNTQKWKWAGNVLSNGFGDDRVLAHSKIDGQVSVVTQDKLKSMPNMSHKMSSEVLSLYDGIPPSSSDMMLTSRLNNKKCLDVRGGNMAHGTNIQLWNCNQSALQQKWKFDYGVLRNVKNSGKCLTVNANGNGVFHSGNNVYLADCNGRAAGQLWFESSDGTIRVSKDRSKCLDIKGGKLANGTNIQIWTCNGSNAQKWNFINHTEGGQVITAGVRMSDDDTREALTENYCESHQASMDESYLIKIPCIIAEDFSRQEMQLELTSDNPLMWTTKSQRASTCALTDTYCASLSQDGLLNLRNVLLFDNNNYDAVLERNDAGQWEYQTHYPTQ
jgi:hemolysin